MMAQTVGFIKAVSIKDRNTQRGVAKVYSFKLNDDKWYDNGFKTLEAQKGDKVEVTYKESDWGPKVDSVKVVGNTASTGAVNDPNRERKIIRQSSLKCATEVYSGKGGKTLDVDVVLKLAETFYNWVVEDKKEEVTEDTPF